MSELRSNLAQEYRNMQQKYVYYIIALSVSCIGFSVYKTQDLSLSFFQIPLGLAVISWAISIVCGFIFLKYVMSGVYSNTVYLQIVEGKHPDFGSNKELIEAGLDGFNKAMSTNSDKMSKYFNCQLILFYSGMVLFIIWHIIVMGMK